MPLPYIYETLKAYRISYGNIARDFSQKPKRHEKKTILMWKTRSMYSCISDEMLNKKAWYETW